MPFTKTFNPGEILTASDVNEHLLNGGYQYRETIYYTSSGDFEKADYPWLRAIRVKACGGGGGGGGCSSAGSGQAEGGGAAGGGYAESFITDIAGLDASVTVTRGAGGTGVSGTNGNDGQNSSFGSLVIGNGGGGGAVGGRTTANGQANSSGGVSGTGDLVVFGGAGSVGVVRSGTASFQNDGGSSFLANKVRTSFSFGTNGENGRPNGGGGSGGRTSDATARAGGNGGNGIVIVDLYA